MRVSGTMSRPVLPGSPGVGAADERSHFDGHKQSPLDVWVRFDPSNVVCLRPRRKAPFDSRGKRGQATALFPGFAAILGAKDRARFGPGICQFQRYLRIRADRAEINANVAMLFANGVCERDLPRDSSMPSDLVMICQWASLFTQSMDSRMTICSGGSNGSAALATIRAFPASPKSMSA